MHLPARRRATGIPALTILLTAATLLLAGCGSNGSNGDGDAAASPTPDPRAGGGPPPSFLSIRTAGGQPATLHVEVADDDASRATGLMGRTDLPADQGMAFIWDEPVDTAFWMKDTPLPLSIAFWDTDGRIIDILDMEPCPAEPCPRYGPSSPFIGAVEANQGWFDEHGVAVGDLVELEVRAYA